MPKKQLLLVLCITLLFQNLIKKHYKKLRSQYVTITTILITLEHSDNRMLQVNLHSKFPIASPKAGELRWPEH